MARTSQGTWEERLEELRCQADPEMDELVHRYYQDHQELEDVRSLVLQMLSELGEANRNPAGEPATAAGQAGDRLSALLDPPPLPPWARDEARIARGQAVFADRGLYPVGGAVLRLAPDGVRLRRRRRGGAGPRVRPGHREPDPVVPPPTGGRPEARALEAFRLEDNIEGR